MLGFTAGNRKKTIKVPVPWYILYVVRSAGKGGFPGPAHSIPKTFQTVTSQWLDKRPPPHRNNHDFITWKPIY